MPKRILLCYINEKTRAGKRLLSVMDGVVPQSQVAVYRSIKDLYRELFQVPGMDFIILLLAHHRKEVEKILAFKDLLLDHRIILIVPHGDRKSVAMGHSLYPRFMTFTDSDFSDVRAVVAKMIRG